MSSNSEVIWKGREGGPMKWGTDRQRSWLENGGQEKVSHDEVRIDNSHDEKTDGLARKLEAQFRNIRNLKKASV